MKSHMLLLRTLIHEMGQRCGTSTTLDFKTIERRVEGEGLSFLTIALPEFAKDLEKGLSQARVDSTLFQGYRKSGYLPRFLSGFTSLIFDTSSGLILHEPSVEAIYAVRQICLFFGKVNLPCSDARVAASIAKFVECEQDVRDNDASLSYDDLHQFKSVALRCLGGVMAAVDRKIYDGDIVPRHGPGHTADKLIGNNKFDQTEWTERLETIFPASEFIHASWSDGLANPPVYLEPGAERPVRVVTVPKTLKTPRIIAIEPTCMQYVQQGISECLVTAIESDKLIRRMIGFDNQEPNQFMARRGSRDGSLATLDLSEASDRVSNQLVRAMTSFFPWFSEGVDASRSRKADVPGYGVLRLAKFASMGSALCFPIEAMVFLTVVLCGIEDELRSPLTYRGLLDLVGKVRVYGDDIIVPVEYVQAVISKLETFGFRVNANKSFWTGKFRESCGKEYYAGEDVSIVRLREMLPAKRQHVSELISTVSLRNQMYYAGNWETASWLDSLIGKLIPFPVVLPSSPALGRHSFLGYSTEKVCPHLQRDLVRAYVVDAPIPLSSLSGQGALLKFFLKRGNLPIADRNHQGETLKFRRSGA
jgi:hypothetical protein